MGARMFRYLFENTSNAIVMTGCSWDKSTQEQIRYAYSCEMVHRSCQNMPRQMLHSGRPIHLFVMGAFTVRDIERLIYAVQNCGVDTVILPYIPPIQRFLVMQMLMNGGKEESEIAKFVKSPYEYLKKSSVKQFFFIYGNGKSFENAGGELYPGYHFENQDREILDIIYEMEGCRIPVMKAGYIINNRMLFYFGYFGVNLRVVRHFVHHFVKNGAIEKFGERQLQKMLLVYRKEFGDPGMDSLAMFCTPTEVTASQTDCVLNTIVIDKDDFCHADIEGDEGRCTLKCMLYNDSDVCRCHRTGQAELRAGVLLLGNIKLSRHMPELKKHYKLFMNQIRALTLPNCGHINNWDSELADMDVKKNAVFWICPLHTQVPDRVLREIKAKNARNRIIGLNEEYGCCFNGFLSEKAL